MTIIKINKKKTICDFCENEKKALYKCKNCKKDLCTTHRYFLAFIEHKRTYHYKQQICYNICPNCFHKITFNKGEPTE